MLPELGPTEQADKVLYPSSNKTEYPLHSPHMILNNEKYCHSLSLPPLITTFRTHAISLLRSVHLRV